MCSDNPELPKEANKAKCFVISCFVFSIFSMIGFGAGIPGIVGGVCGILACVASSILMCCAPKTTAEGAGKFTAAFVMLLIAGILQVIMAIAILVTIIIAVTAVQESDYCSDRFKSCDFDDNGCSCTGGDPEVDNYDTSMCSWYDHTDGLCFRDVDNNSTDISMTCTDQSTKDFCESVHGGVQDVLTGIILIVFGIALFFQATAGILNTLGATYCFKAKKAMATAATTGTAGAATPAVAVATASVVAADVAEAKA
jgi:hypothetical protein